MAKFSSLFFSRKEHNFHNYSVDFIYDIFICSISLSLCDSVTCPSSCDGDVLYDFIAAAAAAKEAVA